MAVNQVAATESYLSSRQEEELDTHTQERCIINLEPHGIRLSIKSSLRENLGEILIFESDRWCSSQWPGGNLKSQRKQNLL